MSDPATVLRVLVVDDDVDASDLLSMCLEREGFATHSASTVPEARSCLDRGEVDAVVTDANVSLDGDGLLLLTPSRPLGLRAAIVLTGDAGSELRRRSLASGFDEVLVKPVVTERLAALIRRLCAVDHLSGSSDAEG